MADQRLPIVNSDDGVWGTILRQYLMKEHYNDDTDNAVNGGHQFVTIRAGTTSAAPLTLTSGPLRTAAAIGAIEFNNDTLYFTKTTGTTRMEVVMDTGSQTLTNKTINMASNTITGTMAQFNTAVSDGDIDYALIPTAVKTSNYTAAANELVLVDCGTSNVVVTLPSSPADGTKVGVSVVGLSSTGKTVTLHTTGSAKFNISIDGVFANWTDLPTSITTTVQYKTSTQLWTVVEYQQTQTSVAEANHSLAADTLTTSRTFQTNLASTSAVGFNGSANNVHGVTGTLPVSNGGTGATTFSSGNVLTGAGTGAVTATKAAPSGAFVGTTDSQTLTNKWLQPRIVTPSVSSTYTIDVTVTDQYNIINQNSNISSITTTGSPVDGQKIMVRIKSDGTARTVAWGSIFISSGVSALLNTTVASKTHHIAFVYDSTAAKFVCLACDVNGY